MTETLASRTGSALGWQAIQFAGVKVIYFVRLLVLARMLSPDDFGLFSVSLVAMELLMALTNPGVQQALVQSRDPKARDYDAAYTIGLIRALLVAAPLVVAAPWMSSLLAEPRASLLIQLLALRPFLQAAVSVRVAELLRNLTFGRLAAIALVEATFDAGVAILLAGRLGVWALVWGPLAGSSASLVVSYVVAPYRPRLTLARAAVRPLVVYGRWIFLGGILSVGINVVIRVAITRQLGAAELGLYFLAGKLAFLAWEASTGLVERVAFPLYARLQEDHDEAQRTFRFFLSAVAAFLVPASCVLIVVAPSLVESLLGPRWEGTVPLIRLLAAVPVVGLLGSAVSPLFLGFGRPRAVTVLEVVRFSAVVGALWPLLDAFGTIGAPLAVLIAGLASQLVALVQLFLVLRSPFAGVTGRLAVIVVAAAMSCVVAWGVDGALPGAVGVIAGVAAAMVAMVSGLLLGDRWQGVGIVADLARFSPRSVSRLLDSRRSRRPG